MMIKDLISKLMQEASVEAEHKGWCDTELTTNQQTRDKKTEEVNVLNSEIEDLTATIAQLTQDLADLTQALKELADDMSKETAERNENKAKNAQTVADAKAAQSAVEDAMAVLKDFYAKSAEATAFAQQKQTPGEDAPETFDSGYTGMGTSGGNVVDFLEVILTDFSRLESETSTDEAMESDEFKTFMFESEKDQALKENDMKHKQEKKTQKESALHSTEEELKLTQEALDKANAYYEKLKPTCVDSGITYEERVKRREAEMQSLSEALKILSGTDVDVKF
jgi:DNA repair exonuclease SbcCD ATPase subunit